GDGDLASGRRRNGRIWHGNRWVKLREERGNVARRNLEGKGGKGRSAKAEGGSTAEPMWLPNDPQWLSLLVQSHRCGSTHFGLPPSYFGLSASTKGRPRNLA